MTKDGISEFQLGRDLDQEKDLLGYQFREIQTLIINKGYLQFICLIQWSFILELKNFEVRKLLIDFEYLIIEMRQNLSEVFWFGVEYVFRYPKLFPENEFWVL